MGMCMKKQGRWGSRARPPSRPYLKKIVPKPKPKICIPTWEMSKEMSDWARTQGLDMGTAPWVSLDDKKIKGITSITGAVKLGVPRTVAPRVVAKIAGLVARGSS